MGDVFDGAVPRGGCTCSTRSLQRCCIVSLHATALFASSPALSATPACVHVELRGVAISQRFVFDCSRFPSVIFHVRTHARTLTVLSAFGVL